MLKRIQKYLFLLLIVFYSNTVLAINPLPGSVEPGLVKQNYLPTQLHAPKNPTAPINTQEEATNPFGKKAEKIKFKLTKIILLDNHVYSQKELSPLYKDKLNKIITIGQLLDIVQDITNYYRNNGYILSRAILPPQHVKNGIVEIRILEGYVDQVRIVGDPRGARKQLLKYGRQIRKNRPLQVDTLEYYLYIANEMPGVRVKSVFEPSKTAQAASDLNLVVEEQIINPYISYDDYGTRYIGPHQITAAIGVNSIFRSGDLTRFTYLTATKDHELRYGDLYYTTPLGSHGLQLILDANDSITHPGFVLAPLNTIGKSNIYSATLQYPMIRSSKHTLTLDGGFTYLNARSTQLGQLLYNDHIRPVQVGATYSLPDRFLGFNVISLHLMQGLNIFDASNNRNSIFTSHLGADGIFTKMNLNVSRSQTLFDRFSAFFVAQGQYTFNPLLTSEQFAFGGSQLGRGYDPAELLGDEGLAGSAELRFDIYPDKFGVSDLQLYAFYDIGVIWNTTSVHNNPPVNQSAASTGFGFRLTMSKYISGNFMLAQPLTKPVAAEALIGRARNPRTFFSIVAQD